MTTESAGLPPLDEPEDKPVPIYYYRLKP